MAKTINYPFKRTILSAEGSAEVIALGITNDYVTKWTRDGYMGALGSWDKRESFPTVVRTGNFVWCWAGEISERGNWALIDVVPDPEVEYQLGNNIAYPALLNGTVGEFAANNLSGFACTAENMKTGDDYITTATVANGMEGAVTDGPYYPLTVSDKHIHVTGTGEGSNRSGFEDDVNYSFDKIVADKWGRSPDKWGGFATTANTYKPRLIGWGPAQYLLTNNNTSDGDYLYGLWPPFATYEQFQTLYGSEKDWIYQVYNTNYKTLFGYTYLDTIRLANNQAIHSAGAQYSDTADIENEYPFTVAEMIPNTVYRDIPGDNTGNGIDDSISPAEALLLLEGVESLLPALDASKCIGFDIDLDIKLPEIDMSFAKDAINKLKADVTSAVSSTALSGIAEKAEGLKASLLASLPEIPEFPNLAAELAKLNPLDLSAIDALKEKWGGVVGDIESLLSDLGNIDICSLVGVDAKIGPDGLILKSKPPEPPEKPVEEPTQNTIVPYSSQDHPQDQFQADRGLTLARTAELEKVVNDAWKKVETASAYSSLLEGEVDNQKKILAFESRNEVQQLALGPTVVTEFFAPGGPPAEEDVLTEDQIKEEEEKLYPTAYIASSITRAISSARKQITAKLMSSNQSGISPKSDPALFWLPPSLIGVGSKIPAAVGKSGALTAIFNEESRDKIVAQYVQINKAIAEHIFTEEILGAAEDVVIGKGSPHTNKNTTSKRSSGYSGGNGDAGSETSNRSAGAAVGPASGEVKYCSWFKGQTRNQPLQQSLMDLLVAVCASGPGYSMLIVSGGQDYKGTRGARRTGSIRHDGGYAADVTIYSKEGRTLSGASRNGKDIEAMKELVKHFKANGIFSIGAGPGYMGGNWHVDISPTAGYRGTWGRSHGNSSTPSWLRSAFYS